MQDFLCATKQLEILPLTNSRFSGGSKTCRKKQVIQMEGSLIASLIANGRKFNSKKLLITVPHITVAFSCKCV